VTPDLLVVGGGVVGCAVAAECARKGMSLVLCERGSLAGAASALDLALIRRDTDASRWLELHHFTGGSFFLDRSPPDDWPARRIDVRAAAAALASETRSYGGEVRTGCDVKAQIMRGGSVRGALTDAGGMTAGTTLVAAGADSSRLCAPLGIELPIRSLAGELLILARPDEALEAPLLDGNAWVAPLPSGQLVAARPEGVPRAAIQGLAVLSSRTVVDYELIGPVPDIEGLTVACSEGPWGASLAPTTAAALATALVA
jgi:glycine/D-amino acid oxidase-like deaminating enzyme